MTYVPRCITYLDETSIVKDVTERRRLLHESFRFPCGCARCVHEESDTQARKTDPAYAAFVDAHLVQLKAMDFPPVLYGALYKKLRDEVFDAGRAFEFLPSDERVSATSELCVYTKGALKANSDVFLIGACGGFRSVIARCLH